MDVDLLISIGFVGFGAYAVIFNKSFARTAIRQQRAVWGVDSSSYEMPIRIFTVIVGLALMGFGIADLSQILSS